MFILSYKYKNKSIRFGIKDKDREVFLRKLEKIRNLVFVGYIKNVKFY